MAVVTGEARLDAEVAADAAAKVGAKGEAHFSLLEDAGDGASDGKGLSWPPPERRMAIPKQRRR